jgi:hypothetical protein
MKNITTLIFITLLAMLTTVTGCATISDAISQNKFVVSAATRQAVGRFIAHGNTPGAERERALAVHERAGRVLKYLDGSPLATYDDLVSVLESSVDWSSLDTMDRLLVQDILTLAKAELKQYALAGDILPDDELINLRSLLLVASDAALVFLEQ